MEIGSIYSITTLEKEQCLPCDLAGNDALYFSLCREALLNIAIRYRDSSRKVLLPAYTCQTVIDPFQQEGWKIIYYNINRNLRIDFADLQDKFTAFKPNLCVVHPYYGADLNQEELEKLRMLKEKGCKLVEDLTQCVFSVQYDSVFDYFLGSYRKWFPIPDGAFLKCVGVTHQVMEENQEFVRPMADAMYLRGVFHKTEDANIKEISRRVGNEAIAKISNVIEQHVMSEFSWSLLSKIDVEDVKRRRFDNYKYLYNHLTSVNNIELPERKLEEITCAPLFFPVYVKNRAEFQRRLALHEIYAPVLWPVHTSALLINNDIKCIFDEILMLPIDQRYGVEDMKRMINVIQSW